MTAADLLDGLGLVSRYVLLAALWYVLVAYPAIWALRRHRA